MKKIFCLLLFFLLSSLRLFSQTDFFELGKEVYFKALNDSAIVLFTEAINSNQHVAESYMMRGMSRAFRNDIEGGLEDLSKSKTLDSTDYKLYYYYGKVYVLSGRYNEAVLLFDRALRMNPNDPDCYDQRAIAKSLTGKILEAISDENTAIKIDSSKAKYYNNRGWLEYQAGQYKEAINDYNTSLIKVPVDFKTLTNRGMAFESQGRYQDAINDFSQALIINPNAELALYWRGICYIFIGEKNKACDDFSKSAGLKYEPALKMKNENCK